MKLKNNSMMENYDSQNINVIRSILEKERINGPNIKQSYTMIQKNAPCDVKVTEQSRRISADTILK